MKKYIPIAIIALLTGAQIAAVAGPMHDHAQKAEIQAKREELQKKMAVAKTVEERQELISEQQKKMQSVHSSAQSNMHAQMNDHGHGYRKGRPTNSEQIQKHD